MDIMGMIKLCIYTVSAGVLQPDYNFGFVLFLFIIYLQYKKNVGFQEIVYGKPKIDLKNLMLTSILAGVVGGLGISIFMTFIGVSVGGMGIAYLIALSVFLMLIEPRFLCFSYSGGLLSLFSLLFGFPQLDVSGILSLVAMLHLLEAALIYFDGFRGSIPVFLEREDGTIEGGFTMQRFWPIPISMLIFAGYGTATGDVISTPDWWPVIRPYIEPGRIQEALFNLYPFAAILGYGEFTSSYLPKEKCKNTAVKLAIFSLILLLLSIISTRIYIFKFLAALFAPLGHEILIEREKRLERKRESLFLAAGDGVKVLDVIPEGPAEAMGIGPGDTIVSINNRPVRNEGELIEFFNNYITFIWVDIKDRFGKLRTIEYQDYKEGISSLEIIFIPENKEELITVKERKSFLKRMIDRLRKK